MYVIIASRTENLMPVPDCDGLITQSLLMGNFASAVDICLHNGRMAEAIILSIAGGPDLLAQTQRRFFQKRKGSLNRVRWLDTKITLSLKSY